MLEDLTYALRTLAQRPGFTTVAVLTLGLGIGANTAIFSVVNGVLLQPLPYPGPEKLVRLYGVTVGEEGLGNLSPLDFLDLRAMSRSLDGVSAFANRRYTWVGSGDPVQLDGIRVTPGYFEVAGLAPAQGRGFSRSDGVPGAPSVVVLSHRLWQSAFGGDPAVVGSTIAFEEESAAVVGIAAASFVAPGYGSGGPTFWTNFRIDPERHGRGGHWVRAVGRLSGDASVEQAQAELTALMSTLEERYPDTNAGEGVAVVPLLDASIGDVRPMLLVLLGAVGFVLLIACSNVANLFLARAVGRAREVAIRAALGAGRGRLVRQLLTESAVLALLGGAFGLALAVWGVDALLALSPGDLPRLENVAVDGQVLAFALGLSLLTGVLFGLVPAIRISSTDLNHSLKEGGRGAGDTGHQRERHVLVVVQVALALILLTGAGLLSRSFRQLLQVDPGFRADGVLSLRVTLPASRYEPPARVAFYRDAVERLSAVPGVESVGIVNALPLSDNWSCDGFGLDDRPRFEPGDQVCAEARWATPGYFEAMRIPLVDGRMLDERDGSEKERSILINRTMARRFWPEGSPIGRRLTWRVGWWTIVGVVGDVKHFGLDRDARSEVYMPHGPGAEQRAMFFALRSTTTPDSLVGTVRHELAELDARLPLTHLSTMEQAVSGSLAQRRFNLLLLLAFAGVALVLALIGVFGVMSYTVNQRVREIGLRVALGARGADIYRMVLRQGLLLAAAGIACGLVGAAFLSRFLTTMLFGIQATDPPTFVAVPLLQALVVAIACLLPARRATRIDPLTALRED